MTELESAAWWGCLDDNACAGREKSWISAGRFMNGRYNISFGGEVNAGQAAHHGQRLVGRPAHWVRDSLTCV